MNNFIVLSPLDQFEIMDLISINFNILNNNNSGNNGKLKFIYFSVNSENNGINNLSDYPLNLLFDINILL